MGWFGIGEKDRYGRQKRIAHEGKYLRASRSAGVSLRAQTRAAGLNLTANTRHGFRVSHRIGRKTQIAMQNNRLVLRGRYGNGPTRFNMSKSGLTISTRNPFGTINWVKPNRSSAKLFGVQVRGQKALVVQVIMLAVTSTVALVTLAINAIILMANLAIWLSRQLWNFLARIPDLINEAAYGWRMHKIRRARDQLYRSEHHQLNTWSEQGTITALELLFLKVARGQSAISATTTNMTDNRIMTGSLATLLGLPALALKDIELIALQIDQMLVQGTAPNATTSSKPPIVPYLAASPPQILALTALTAGAVRSRLKPTRLPELLYALDELILSQGERNVLQEQMFEVLANECGLRLTPAT